MRPPANPLSKMYPSNPGSLLHQTTKSLKENQGAFEIQTLEWFIQNNKGAASRLRSYEILWIKKGTGQLTVDITDITITENKVYLFRPGQFRHLNPGHEMEGYYMSVSSDFFHLSGSEPGLPFLQTSYKTFDGPFVIHTDEEVQQEAEDILVKLSREFTHYASSRTGILKGLFKIFMLYLLQKTEHTPSPANYCAEKELVNRFMQLLKINFTTKKLVSDYASDLCVTPGHLNRIVKKISGFPVSHHIQQEIILEAKKQATWSNQSMKEIAYLLGFDDTAHFSKFFKNNSGMNFSNFKRLALV